MKISQIVTVMVLLMFASWAAESFPTLPNPLNGSNGKTFANAKIIGVQESGVRVMHDGGLVNLPFNQLPPEVQTALGRVPEAAVTVPTVALPNPWRMSRYTIRDDGTCITLKDSKVEWTDPKLSELEPDGIQVNHSSGSVFVPHELIADELKAKLGGFDPAKALAHRMEKINAQKQALKSLAEEKAAIQEAERAFARQQVETEKSMAEAFANGEVTPGAKYPDLSRLPQINIGGGSFSYGKKERGGISTSKRSVRINVATESRQPVRVQVEWFFFGRSKVGKDLVVADQGSQKVALNYFNSASLVAHGVVEGEDRNTDITKETKGNMIITSWIHRVSGSDYKGWGCRAIDADGRVLAVAGPMADHAARVGSIGAK